MSRHLSVFTATLLSIAVATSLAQTTPRRTPSPEEREAITTLLQAGTLLSGQAPDGRRISIQSADGPEVTSVNMGRRAEFDPNTLVAKLAALPSLKEANIQTAPLSDAGIAAIAKLDRLETLTLYQLALGDKVQALKTLKNLKSLSLNENQITDTGVTHLEPLTQLEELNLSGNLLSDSALPSIAKFTHLRTLEIRQSSASSSRMSIGDAGIQHLKGLAELRMLDITNLPVTDNGLAHLTGLKLEILALGGDTISDTGIAEVAKITSLQQLLLLFPKITDEAMPSIAKLANLQRLDLNSNAVTDKGLEALKDLKNLTHISIRLGTNRFTGAGLTVLKQLPALKRLDLFPWGTHGPHEVLPLDIDALAELKTLENLWLTNVQINENTAAILMKMTWLKSLTFAPGNAQISPELAARLQRALPTTRITGIARKGSGAG